VGHPNLLGSLTWVERSKQHKQLPLPNPGEQTHTCHCNQGRKNVDREGNHAAGGGSQAGWCFIKWDWSLPEKAALRPQFALTTLKMILKGVLQK